MFLNMLRRKSLVGKDTMCNNFVKGSEYGQKPYSPQNLFNFQYISKKLSSHIDYEPFFHGKISLRGQSKISHFIQYLVCPPLAWITAIQRRLMLFIRRWMNCQGIRAHSSCKARSRSLTLLTSFLPSTLRPR